MAVFTLQQKVLFRHCDPAGIVFYPRYFEMINDTVEAWFDARVGVTFEAIHGSMGAAVPTAAMDIRFCAPSRHGDVLTFTLTPKKIGRTSLKIAIEAHCGAELRLSLNSTLVYINKTSGRPERWPEQMRRAIQHDLDQAVAEHV